MILLQIDIKPKLAPRPRVMRWGTYNDPKYTAYKGVISGVARAEVKRLLVGALKMSVFFQFKKPKSWSKKKNASAYWHIQKPDLDNLIKGVKDALNGIAYKDDAQVCDMDAIKIWGECDLIVIEIEEI